MPTNVDISTLISGLQISDPRLYQALVALNDRLGDIEADLFPLVNQAQTTAAVEAALPPPVTFTSTLTATTVRFNWSEVLGASAYEIREGTVWDTASFRLRTNSLQADIDPLLEGSHTFLIKSLSTSGLYSTTVTQCVVIIPAIGTVTISKAVIDNNVLLSWTAPTSSFRILEYEIYKDGDLVGTVDSTFFTRFENVAGTYVYRVVAVDIAGNRSPNSDISVQVLSPPDYAFQDQRTSDLSGTLTNVLLQPGPKLLASWVAETFEHHFTSRAWLSPKNQVDAGYPIYLQPSSLTGVYEEVIDYGVALQNVIATITFNTNLLTPDDPITTVVKMATSTDGVNYSAFTSGAGQFLPSLRYLKFRLEFTGSDKSLMEVFNVVITLNVKRENDGGSIDALATDVGGTEIFFNKEFKDIESLTATVKSTTEPFITIVKFTDVPNPTSFFVYAFDTSGNRVSKTVEWKARGIV